MKKAFKIVLSYVFFIFISVLIVSLEYQAQIRDIKQRYKEKHQVATDLEIETFEYVFDVPCDSTCYH